jgi:hypothetical protein
MASSRVLLYGESYELRHQSITPPAIRFNSMTTMAAAPQHNSVVTVNFAATNLPVLSRCGEFLVHRGPSYCALESSEMTLEQVRAVLASGELFDVAAGEVVWNALLAADDDADGGGDDECGDSDINDGRALLDANDFAGLLFVAGVVVRDGAVVSDLVAPRPRRDEAARQDDAASLRALASRATMALATLAGVAPAPLAVGVGAQVLAFGEAPVVAMQVSPVKSGREVLLLWGVRWDSGKLRAAVDSRASGVLARVRVLQFSPTAVFDEIDNDALLTLCLRDMPSLQALCLKGATGVSASTIVRLIGEHKALRFVCVVGAKRPDIGRELASAGVVEKNKLIVLPLGAVALSDSHERAKRAAYDWLMASAASRYSVPLVPAAAPSVSATTTVAAPPQVVFRSLVPVVTLTDAEHQLGFAAADQRSFVRRVLAHIDSGGGECDFPLPIPIANASLFAARDADKKKFVEYRTLLLDKAGKAFVDLSLWCAAGFVLIVNWCTMGNMRVTWRECSSLQPLLAQFARYFLDWTGSDWSGASASVEQHLDKPVSGVALCCLVCACVLTNDVLLVSYVQVCCRIEAVVQQRTAHTRRRCRRRRCASGCDYVTRAALKLCSVVVKATIQFFFYKAILEQMAPNLQTGCSVRSLQTLPPVQMPWRYRWCRAGVLHSARRWWRTSRAVSD